MRWSPADPGAPKWWEKSIVKRSTSSIERMVETMMEGSQFLLRSETNESMAAARQHLSSSSSPPILSLHRSNVQTGALLGKGSFSVVLEVNAIVEEEREEEEEGDCSVAMMALDNRHCLQDAPQHTNRNHNQNNTRGRRYAIKHLRPDLIQKNSADYFQDAAADLIMEAKYLGALNHPGILRLRGIANGGVSAYQRSGDYDSFFLLTDRLDGTLKDRILEYQCIQQEESLLECFRSGGGGGPPPPPPPRDESKEEAAALTTIQDHMRPIHERLLIEKIDIALQLAQALRYLHEQNLIFRDLKPQNVGLVGNTVQLFDFGFCRELPSDAASYSSVAGSSTDSADDDEQAEEAVYYMSGKGSLMYLAPEVLGSGRYNQKVDCYSYAMVLYELLTLNKPFHAAANINVFREMICHHKARPPLEFSDIPLSIQDLLQHAWDDSVHDRWSMRQICVRLQEIATELEATTSVDLEDAEAQAQDENTVDATSPIMWLPPTVAACGGGEALSMLADFARDLRRGYDILTGQAAKKVTNPDQEPAGEANPFKSSPVGSLDSIYYDSMLVLEDDLACPTAETEDITSASSFSFGIQKSPSTATEDPLEVTFEQTMSMVTDVDDDDDEDDDDGEDFIERERRVDNEADGDDMEMRCPPSPPKRTISAPLAFMKLTASTNNLMDEAACPAAMTRRQSCTGVGMLPRSHWLPSAVELRSMAPATA